MMRLTIFLLFLFCATSYAQEVVPRGLFVWALDQKPILSSKSQMDELIRFAREYKIQILYVQVYRANKAWFKTKHADTLDYDAMHRGSPHDSFSYLINQAHAYGIEVHAWMNMLSLSANGDAPILKKYGLDILTKNRGEKKSLEDYTIDGQLFLEPSDHRVHKELLAITEDILKAHKDLDGIQFDYLRYPDVQPFYGYSPENIKRFKKFAGVQEFVEEDFRWKQWKRDQVTNLLKELVTKVRSIRKNIHISTTGSLSYSRALDDALQDWPSWIKKGLVDSVTVMNYPSDLEKFEANIAEIKTKLGDFEKLNIAVGAYKFVQDNQQVFQEQYQSCEASNSKACIIFHYSNLLENPSLTNVLK